MSSGLRESTILSWNGNYAADGTAQRFMRHAARGDRTLCGIEHGMSVPDPPSLAAEGATPCRSVACRRALAQIGAKS